MFSIRWRARARVVFLPDRPDGVPSYPTPRCPVAPPCAAPTRPARGVSGFWIRQVGLHRNSLVCASGGTFGGRFFDALESARKDCSLGAQFYWRTVLLDPAPPPRRAPRRDPPVVCSGFGFDKSHAGHIWEFKISMEFEIVASALAAVYPLLVDLRQLGRSSRGGVGLRGRRRKPLRTFAIQRVSRNRLHTHFCR